MSKHRKTMFAVVREVREMAYDYIGRLEFSGLIGVYVTQQRAEEVSGAALQETKDKGIPEGRMVFSVKPVTFYDE